MTNPENVIDARRVAELFLDDVVTPSFDGACRLAAASAGVTDADRRAIQELRLSPNLRNLQ